MKKSNMNVFNNNMNENLQSVGIDEAEIQSMVEILKSV